MTSAYLNYHLSDGKPLEVIIDAGGIAGKRIDPPLESIRVELNNARSLPSPLSFKQDGLELVTAPSQVDNFDDLAAIRAQYDQESQQLIQDISAALEVIVFDHTIRIDEAGVRPPARHVHGDYNEQAAQIRLQELLGEQQAKQWQKSGFGIVNIWRPIDSPVLRAPLAFIQPDTLKPSDWLDIAIIYPERKGYILGVKYDAQHKWLFWPAMTSTEAIVFNVYDSRGMSPVAHSAADLDPTPNHAPTRRSIETRALVRYA